MSMKKHPLETYVAKRLEEITGEPCRPTRASGASTEILDIYNPLFFIECKMTKRTDNFVIKFKEIDKAYNQAKKVGGSNKKFLFIMQNKSDKRIVLIFWEDLLEMLGEEKMDKILAINYVHLIYSVRKQVTLSQDDFDAMYYEVMDAEENKVPAIVFHDSNMNLMVLMDLEDFFYIIEKYVV